MGDQRRWFKVWTSALTDPDLDDLSLEDGLGRWGRFGVYLTEHGKNGTIVVRPPAYALVAALRASNLDTAIQIIRKFPNCRVSAIAHQDAVDALGRRNRRTNRTRQPQRQDETCVSDTKRHALTTSKDVRRDGARKTPELRDSNNLEILPGDENALRHQETTINNVERRAFERGKRREDDKAETTSPNIVTTSVTAYLVVWRNWRKYQGDYSLDRVRKHREKKRVASVTQDVKVYSRETVESVERERTTTTPRSRGAKGPDPDFEKFYRLYPRKVAPAAARRAWNVAVKKAPAGVILAAIEKQAPELKRRPHDKIPYPATWLNGEHWRNEPDETATADPYKDFPTLFDCSKCGGVHAQRECDGLEAEESIARWETKRREAS
jgi:hypothetical protein